ncbi:MAG: membrane protein insertase YidC [Spirochaetaceae bacterium]|jgi:YidC/Oxa1 family membrane protein insertase|nr:membrane protein insertase YidC [Spirochaetaceae bacterium]
MMEKNTLIAVALSVVVLVGTIFVQRAFFPQAPQGVSTGIEAPPETGAPPSGSVLPLPAALSGGESAAEQPVEQRVVMETRRAIAILSSAGGDVVSYRLREHQEGDEYVEMILAVPGLAADGLAVDGQAGEAHAFTVAFGDSEARPLEDSFRVNRLGENVVEFYRDYAIPGQAGGEQVFRLSKRYTFSPDEYMFELAVTLDGGYEIPALNYGGLAYTLGFGPQIGPRFSQLDGRSEYRRYLTYGNGKRREEKLKEGVPNVIRSRLSWAAIAGKYFTLIAVPDATAYTFTFLTEGGTGAGASSRLYLGRPQLNASKTTDVYRFYLGPRDQASLAIYDTGVNAFNLRDMDITKATSSSGILAPVEAVLKWLLTFFYRLVPNYGIAIILLTLLVKVLLFPLTKKGSEATLHMQGLSPRIKELQEKYRDNPAQLNAKMAELYRQEGYNPLSGCFPMLIQFPILIAMYNLFSNHFDLRGAMFIPRWIPDLSIPESVFNFAPAKLPFLGWSDIRLLPFIYVGSQLLSSKITQTPDQQGNAQMKMMLYVMPVMFFFLLYNMPSGLTVYWIMTNLFSMVQQLLINRHLKKKKESMAQESASPVIAPRPGPKKRRKR